MSITIIDLIIHLTYVYFLCTYTTIKMKINRGFKHLKAATTFCELF